MFHYRLPRWLVFFVCLFSMGGLARAQITNVTNSTSTPTPGSGHDYIKMLDETVNPANGSLSIRVGTPTPKARGLTIPFSFAYDSDGAHVLRSQNGAGYFYTNTTFVSQGGWGYGVPLLSAAKIFKTAQLPNGRTEQCEIDIDFLFQGPSADRHALRLATAYTDQYCHNATYASGGDDFVKASFTGICPQSGGSICVPVQVADADGTVFNFDGAFDNFPPGVGNFGASLPKFVEDRNGNKMVVTDNHNGAFTFTDTAGRTAISSSGFGSSGNTVTVSGLSGPYTVSWGTASYNFGVNAQAVYPSSQCLGIYSAGGTQAVITAITLPNGEKYQFSYDPTYGLLNKITYPTGGWIKYAWSINPQSEFTQFPDQLGNASGCTYTYDWPVLSHRYVSFDGTTTALQQDFSYSVTWNSRRTAWVSKQTIVTTHDLIRGTNFQTTYSYAPVTVLNPPYDNDAFATQIPVESTVTYGDWNGATLQTLTKAWQDQYEMTCESKTLPTGQVGRVDYSYGTGFTITDKKEWDWGQAPVCGSTASGTPTRETSTTYQTFANTPIYANGPSIFDLPSQVIIYGAGTPVAETDYSYDQTGLSPVTATGHDDTNYPATFQAPRGNATTVTRKCFYGSQTCSNALTTYAYDQTGQPISETDPNGHATQYSFADNYQSGSGTPPGNTNAYLTTVTYPTVNGVTQHKYFQYAYSDGQLTQSQDDNQKTSNVFTGFLYNDNLRRLTEVDYPDGGKTTFSYNDAAPNPSVTTTKLIAGSIGSPTSTTLGMTAVMDGVGHRVQTQLITDPDGTTYTAASYDGLGRKYQVWNPTRCSPPTTNCGEMTWGVTGSFYDAIGRITKVSKPDGSVVTTSYAGNGTTVIDEVGNQRTSQTDALGRLTTVFEAPNNSSFNYETDYTYNGLDDLLSVTQKGSSTSSSNWRVRSFQYDSLSRLTSASNPESGTISYTYDANSNLTIKVAPKPGVATGTPVVTTNYAYDALNRLIKKSYVNISTAAVQFGYDGTGLTGCGVQPPTISSPSNLVGRRSSMCSGASASSWSYDSMGRPLLESRRNAGYTKNISYQYWLDGSLNQLTYPSGDIVSYTPGGAGRITGVADTPGNSFVYTVTYAPQGAVANMIQAYRITNVLTNSIGISTTNIYNDRLQPVLLSASVSVTSGGVTTNTPVFSLCDDFHLGVPVNSPPCNFSSYTSGDNGNVFQVVNNLDSTRSTTFAYDPLNRISQANTTTTTGSNCWGEIYTIDAWGNLTNRAGVPSMSGCSYEPLNAPANTNNQLTGISYDIAGNVINDGNGNQPTYDAENRIITDAGVTYSYDADGLRIKKSSGTMYWPGPGGETLAEADLSGNINEEYVYFNGERIARIDRPSGIVHYYFSDHLGSANVITDANGNVQEQYFYYPFGGLFSSIGSDTNHYKFTGKERDSESGLDNFGFRYYGSSLGRFMSPDEPFYDGGLEDPQRLNLYSYVRNSPTTSIDPDGHLVVVCTNDQNGKQTCTRMSDQEYYNAVDKAGNSNTGINAPKWGQSGDITCGGVVCGHATYLDEGAVTPLGEQYLTDYAGGRITGRALGALIGTVAGWFGRGAENAATDAATETVNLADKKATTHILDGDATGGGHAPGTGIPGKSEFPAGWGRDKIMHTISDVATDPASKVTQAGRSTLVEGTREGVNIRVVIRDGRIVTGYPTNLPRNP